MVVYKKNPEGTHFYKSDGDKIMHVLANETGLDILSEQHVGRLEIRSVCENNTYLINSVKSMPEDGIDSDEAEFDFAMQRAIFGLGIYKYFKT
jgi:hypothetical protein